MSTRGTSVLRHCLVAALRDHESSTNLYRARGRHTEVCLHSSTSAKQGAAPMKTGASRHGSAIRDRGSPGTHSGSLASPQVSIRRARPQTDVGAQEAHAVRRGHSLDSSSVTRKVFLSAQSLEALDLRLTPQSIRSDDLLFEGSDLNGQFSDVEIGLIAKHRVQDSAQPMRDRDHSHLVSPGGTKLSEIGIEWMALAK